MSPDDQLLHEARVRYRQAVVSVLAGVLLIVAAVMTLGGPHTSVDELTLDLLTANKRFPLDLIAAFVNAIASLAIAWTLVFLYQCTRARNPAIRSFIRTLTLIGGILAALAGIVYAVIVAMKVHQFATTGAQTYDEADHLTSSPGLLALQLAGQLAALLVAVSFVLVSLQAMRVGLLTKFMGYLGMFAGALVLFQITQVPVVQLCWLAALGYMFSGRWPTGLPAAWRTGQSEAWPSSAQMRAQRVAGGQDPSPRGGRAPRTTNGRAAGPSGQPRGLASLFAPRPKRAPEAEPAVDDDDGADSAARTRSSTPKRKRKRRN